MNFNQSIVIIGMLFFIFFILIVKNKMQKIINLVIRGGISGIAIYCLNYFLFNIGIAMGIGINLLNILTATILGIPGIVLLYAIHLTNYL